MSNIQLLTVVELRRALIEDDDVSDLVGSRVYPLVVDMETWSDNSKLPFVVYSIASLQDASQFNEDYPADGLYQFSYQVAVYTLTYDGAHNLSWNVRKALESGNISGEGVKVDTVRFEGDGELFDDTSGMYVRTLAYTVYASGVE